MSVFFRLPTCRYLDLPELCNFIHAGDWFELDEVGAKGALFFVAKNDFHVVVDALDSKGLGLNITDEKGKTTMFYANQNHSLFALCELIREGARFELEEIDAKAALFFAAKNDFIFVVEKLKRKGLDLNITDNEGKTAVFYANQNHSLFVLCELIREGARFQLEEIDAKAALFFAAENDCIFVVEELKRKGLDLNITDFEGKTAVFYGNLNDSLFTLCELIREGARFELEEIDAKAALFFAAKNDFIFVVEKLKRKGLDLNITDNEGKTAVFYANQNHSLFVLCELIREGARFQLEEIDAKAALFFAAENDCMFVVEELKRKGLDLNITDNEGKTAVFYANQNHSPFVLCELIREGARFQLEEIDAKAALFFAAENDCIFVVEELKRKGLDLNITDNEGKTAVFYANQNHSLFVLCELIREGARFQLEEIDAKAALFFAAENDCIFVVEELKRKGLDLNITDFEGKTAVFYGNLNDSLFTLYELIREGARFELEEIDAKAALFFAAKNDFIFVVEKLKRKGLDLNITDNEGKTAVFYANQNHSLFVLCELIREGARFQLEEIDAKAALFFAAENDCMFVVEELKRKGLDLNITDNEGKTAVFYANQNHSPFVLCELIREGARFQLEEIDAKAALFFAAENDCIFVVEELKRKGLDLNITDNEGKTAVFYANQNDSMNVLCELVACGAKINSEEIDLKSALFYAAENNYPNVLIPLRRAGVDLNTADRHGKTVVFCAHEDFLDVLKEFDEVLVNKRDLKGRTALFYAFRDGLPDRIRRLVEMGANCELKDNCNVNIFLFFADECILKNTGTLKSFSDELFQQPQQLKALTQAIFDAVFCQVPLFSIPCATRLPKSYRIFETENVLKALDFAREKCLIYGDSKIENIDKISSMIKSGEIDIQRLLNLLSQLGANPDAADSAGNTAVHYATILPLLGGPQDATIHTLKKVIKFGASLIAKNHDRQTPLQFLLSPGIWKLATEHNDCHCISIRVLPEVCNILIRNQCSNIDDSESIFRRIIVLIQHGFQLKKEASRNAVLQALVNILMLLSDDGEAFQKAVNNTDELLNTPLHLWASITLESPEQDTFFEEIMRTVLDHLLKCGAKLNRRNANDETPLHLCKTWTAAHLLLDSGANPNDLDSSGCSPILVTFKEIIAQKRPVYFSPNVAEELDTFWKTALQKGLDPLITDKQGNSLLSVLIESGSFALAKALLEVVCQQNYATNDVKISLLNVICQDKSTRTHWKYNLAEIILKSCTKSCRSLERPLRLCCRNIVEIYDRSDSSQEQQNDDAGQPPLKKRKKDESTKDDEITDSNDKLINDNLVHCKIAKEIISHGADITIADASEKSCLDIAKDCPFLLNLLTNPVDNDDALLEIPWTSISIKHNSDLGKVARRQECVMKKKFWYHKDCIGRGAFGDIFAGIDVDDGREVAVKRIRKSCQKPSKEVEREIKNLAVLAGCDQVVKYISFWEDEFYNIILELMEGNLDDYLQLKFPIDVTKATLGCKDIMEGLTYLHQQKIVHRDLKPQNILYKLHPRPCLKIADFGLSRATYSMSTTVGVTRGSRCWMAPEVLKAKNSDVTNNFDSKSDIFPCGLLFHYILSGRKHPFEPVYCANKGELKVAHETEDNIMKGRKKRWDNSLHPEASHLIKRMLESKGKSRPKAEEARDHPLFWSNGKKIHFLEKVGNEKEFASCLYRKTSIVKKVENSFGLIAKGRQWDSPKHNSMPEIYKEMTTTGKGRCIYDTMSAVELVRFIRNVYEHYKEKKFKKPERIKQLLFKDFLFLKNFPDLVIEIYKAVITYRWDKNRADVECVLKT